jgi:protocatechuate 3,4-dioxygenase beta subunit
MMITRTRPLSALALTLVLAAGAPAFAQQRPPAPPAPQPPRDLQPATAAVPTGTGSISGTVVIAGSGQPARRARVNLSGAELRGGRTATTDAEGRFAFQGLPAGRFTVSASKTGHVNITFGQRKPGSGRPGTPIQLGDGQKVQVALQLPKGGVISGTVLDEHGDPVPGTQVRAMRFMFQNGQRALSQTGNAATDDRGIYRIYGLQPGDYVVCAVPRNNTEPGGLPDLERMRTEMEALRQRADAAARDQLAAIAERVAILQSQPTPEEPVTGYAPVYYPGTSIATGAGSVPLAVSEERLGVDFQLQLVPMARVEGTVAVPAGQEGPNVRVMLVNASEEGGGVGSNGAQVSRDGRFSFNNVAPGQYTLVANSMIGGRQMPGSSGRGGTGGASQEPIRLYAAVDIAVDGRNLSNIVLALQPGVSISGKLDVQSTAPQAQLDLTRARVTLTPAERGPAARDIGGPATGRVDATGRFKIPGVVPGRYRLMASLPGGSWSMESATLGGQDALDFPAEITANQNIGNAIVTLTDQQSELSGAVTDAQGRPVSDYSLVVYAADQRYWIPDSRRIRSVRPATDGTFKITNLPAGEYRIAPVLDPEPGAWFDPSFLQQLDSAATSLTVNTGEKKVQNVRIGGFD